MTLPASLPPLVGLCPVHALESYAPVDPADPDPKCPACDCRLLVYAPRVDQRDRRNAEAGGDRIARAFHEAYERLAPRFGYSTREASAKPWDDVPEDNKRLMRATVRDLIDKGVIAPSSESRASEDRR